MEGGALVVRRTHWHRHSRDRRVREEGKEEVRREEVVHRVRRVREGAVWVMVTAWEAEVGPSKQLVEMRATQHFTLHPCQQQGKTPVPL